MLNPKTDITDKVLTRRSQGPQTILSLTYPEREAAALRSIALRVTLKGDKKASLSLIARRALQLYVNTFQCNTASELAALTELVTPIPRPAPYSKQKHR